MSINFPMLSFSLSLSSPSPRPLLTNKRHSTSSAANNFHDNAKTLNLDITSTSLLHCLELQTLKFHNPNPIDNKCSASVYFGYSNL
ncbi:hypothetical protein KC19_1G220500 [Ceratodon purpureus]|uniref:Uncharacterized protein n=1 Tax=Ceratodon purpureus TaxID=3225 RepID=A0A8T0J812_CERPU|nr:hypothetical protein KC19_1G220500 [Ceratodon purpureus]